MSAKLLGMVAAVLLFAASASAQNTGSVTGVVKDSSGGVLPGVDVVLSNTQTGVQTATVTGGDGTFVFGSLVPGTYTSQADLSGFNRYVGAPFELHVGDRLTLNVTLEIGTATEEVTVTASAPLLRTADAQVGEVVSNQLIANLPQLNRNPFALVALAGNVQGSMTQNAQGQNSLQINGGRTSSVDYYVDGGVVNSGQANRISNQVPSMDAVAEFKVITSGISAEFGRISGGFVTLVTKGGTNQIRGSLYNYMFDDVFNANSWEQNSIGAKKADFSQFNFGGTVGGPVVIPGLFDGHNRTFFFIENENLRRDQSGTVTLSSVPTALERQGDFSQTTFQGRTYLMYDPWGPQVFNAARGLWERTGLLGGDGRHVPANLISPVSRAILAMIPMPNRPSVAQQQPEQLRVRELEHPARLPHRPPHRSQPQQHSAPERPHWQFQLQGQRDADHGKPAVHQHRVGGERRPHGQRELHVDDEPDAAPRRAGLRHLHAVADRGQARR